MMNQAHDGPNSQISKASQPLVRPAPVKNVGGGVAGTLPQNGIAEGANAELGEEVQVVQARSVTATFDLIEVPVPYAIYRACDAGPEFNSRQPRLDIHS